ncbi:hypothetical protein SK128_028502, partial [Halocaridina rubra]
MVSLRHTVLSTQITAVKVKEDIVAIGEGQYLHIHDLTTGVRLSGRKVFCAAVIHGICIKKEICGSSDSWQILVWGQKSFTVLGYNPSQKQCCMLSREYRVDDWIVDVTWDEENERVVIATAHNTLLRCQIRLYEGNYFENKSSLPSTQIQTEECKIIAREQCTENCILYCGCIVIGSGSWESCVLLAGTVFSQILVWGPWGKRGNLGRVLPTHQLSGHEGVLFSINYCPVQNIISSTSDDRSLRVWHIEKGHDHVAVCEPQIHEDRVQKLSQQLDNDNENFWKDCRIYEKLKCYGHGARVWRSLILPSCFISVGEDSKVCIWDCTGTLTASWRAHDGACVWSIAPTEDSKVIVTGGGDGSVKSWCLNLDVKDESQPLVDQPWTYDCDKTSKFNHCDYHINCIDEDTSREKSVNAEIFEYHNENYCSTLDATDGKLFQHESSTGTKFLKSSVLSSKKEDFPRCVTLFDRDKCFVLMDSGRLYCWDFQMSSWSLLLSDERMKKYAVMESNPGQDFVGIGTLCGYIIIIGIDSSTKSVSIVSEEKVCDSKVYSVLWLSSLALLTCASEGIMNVWDIHLECGKISRRDTYKLPACKQRWASAACEFSAQDSSWMLCGERAGGIHLYSKH